MSKEIEVTDVELVDSDPQDAELDGVISLEDEIIEPEAQADEEPESGEEDPAEQPDEDKVSKGVQKRINKFTREKYELQARIRELEEEQAKNSPKTELKEPSLEDFNYDQGAYKQALIEYGSSQAQKQKTTAPQVDPVKAEKVAAFSQKLDAFKAKAPDYVDVVSQMPISQVGSDAILEMDNGPQVAYYLGNHLDLVDEINALGPVAAALKIADLSRKLKPAEPKISTAPDPVTSIKSGGGKVTKNEDDMTVEELDALDAQRFAARNG
jgi:hypothetical protein